jgi:hypothetical protein
MNNPKFQKNDLVKINYECDTLFGGRIKSTPDKYGFVLNIKPRGLGTVYYSVYMQNGLVLTVHELDLLKA